MIHLYSAHWQLHSSPADLELPSRTNPAPGHYDSHAAADALRAKPVSLPPGKAGFATATDRFGNNVPGKYTPGKAPAWSQCRPAGVVHLRGLCAGRCTLPVLHRVSRCWPWCNTAYHRSPTSPCPGRPRRLCGQRQLHRAQVLQRNVPWARRGVRRTAV